jgi:hypothetical protein
MTPLLPTSAEMHADDSTALVPTAAMLTLTVRA